MEPLKILTKLEDNCANEDKNIVLFNDTKMNVDIVEVWNNNPQKMDSNKKTKRDPIKINRKTQDNKMKYEDKNYLAFENWKKKKNTKYKQMIKQEQKEKQQKLQTKLAEMESKRLAQMCAHIKKQQMMQEKRKLSKELRKIEQTNIKSHKEQMEMKRIVNDKVFKEWKRRKDIKLKEQKILYDINNYHYFICS
ncbi:coiled-coil domain-containing protein 112-like [Polistes fuscatus]|uniref:coiled-coil domain-containing protein 112-like n=1 Tax=Polistes fuscatus TaxID=30207 RepID=UPI001CA7F682|nr:coiled-coil domain-containing protein 112-like [Polistes fuscatus]